MYAKLLNMLVGNVLKSWVMLSNENPEVHTTCQIFVLLCFVCQTINYTCQLFEPVRQTNNPQVWHRDQPPFMLVKYLKNMHLSGDKPKSCSSSVEKKSQQVSISPFYSGHVNKYAHVLVQWSCWNLDLLAVFTPFHIQHWKHSWYSQVFQMSQSAF